MLLTLSSSRKRNIDRNMSFHDRKVSSFLNNYNKFGIIILRWVEALLVCIINGI
jgi:hypothetical protein